MTHVEFIRSTVSKKRFDHSVSVAKMAEALSRRHGWKPEKAKSAGLLHDCVKEWPIEKLKRAVKKWKVVVPNKDFVLKNAPSILHSYVGAEFVRRELGVKDRGILKAMAAHTIGAYPISLSEKILYVADFCSHGRSYKEAAKVRSLALQDLDQGFKRAVFMKIYYQLAFSKPLHPLSIKLWNTLQ